MLLAVDVSTVRYTLGRIKIICVPSSNMPGLIVGLSSRSSSRDSTEDDRLNIGVSRDEYPALSFPGYAEKPLNEQLEPVEFGRLPASRRCRIARGVLGHDHE